MDTRVGDLEVSYSARGNPAYRIELLHPGLKLHREIRGNNRSIVERKAHLQIATWDDKWSQLQERQTVLARKRGEKEHLESQKATALARTTEAQAATTHLDNILADTLSVDDAIDWDALRACYKTT